ncbi:unnamed protein product, partial [Mesorhabditis belari]|uniref:Battenin n=1 Tax=Mesorhabditis belari TaxID=2138241 RepID=A0AAF3J5R8_9BILA
MGMKKAESASWRTLVSFWLFGLCNNLPHILMLSAAEDINAKGNSAHHKEIYENGTCPLRHGVSHCGAEKSTGIILFADAFPSIIVKILVMFFAQNVSYTVRHSVIVTIQVIAMVIVACTESYPVAVFAVGLALCGVGLGESTFISFSSYFSRSTTIAWSSGTGAAGIVGSALYAALTEPQIVNLSPKNALLVMLVFTFTLGLTYWFLLDHPQNLYRIFQAKYNRDAEMTMKIMREKPKVRETTLKEKVILIKPLLRYLLPVMVVYIAEYTINLGLIQLIVFDCAHGFNLSKTSQYRWFQSIYRVGAFASKSSLSLLDFPVWVLYIFPFLQIMNAAIFFSETLLLFMPHIMVAFGLILVAGLYGGSAMVKCVSHVHKIVEPDIKEFSLAVVATTNGMGVLFASFTGIWFHDIICKTIG